MKKNRVAEATPVQVYLGRTDRQLLERLTHRLETSKSEVLRRALVALEREVLDPAGHPALRIIGIAEKETVPSLEYDVAVEHDRYFVELEEARVRPVRRPRRRAR
jgi:hypothetical protein